MNQSSNIEIQANNLNFTSKPFIPTGIKVGRKQSINLILSTPNNEKKTFRITLEVKDHIKSIKSKPQQHKNPKENEKRS